MFLKVIYYHLEQFPVIQETAVVELIQ